MLLTSMILRSRTTYCRASHRGRDAPARGPDRARAAIGTAAHSRARSVEMSEEEEVSEDVEVEETEIDAEDAVRRARERRARARKGGGGDRPRRVGARRGDRSIARAGGVLET